MIAAFLYAQLENLEDIQNRRKEIWHWYNEHVDALWGRDFAFSKPLVPSYATNNAHMYYLLFEQPTERTRFIKTLKEKDIHPVFHYLSLHKSPYYTAKHDGRELPNSDRYEECLVRLPLWYEINVNEF